MMPHLPIPSVHADHEQAADLSIAAPYEQDAFDLNFASDHQQDMHQMTSKLQIIILFTLPMSALIMNKLK